MRSQAQGTSCALLERGMLDALRAGGQRCRANLARGPRGCPVMRDGHAQGQCNCCLERSYRIVLKVPRFLQESLPPGHVMQEHHLAGAGRGLGPRESLAALFGTNSRKYSLY
jgi:hypothetical protein